MIAFSPQRSLKVWILLSGLVLSLAAPQVARATTIEALTLDELVATSRAIVVGTVTAKRSHYDRLGRIVTDHEVRVDEVWKGKHHRSVSLRSLGGDVGDIGMTVPGEPHLKVGARAVFFLRPSTSDSKRFRPVGMAQGVLPIELSKVRLDSGKLVPTVLPGGAGLRLLKLGPDGPHDAKPALEKPAALGALRTRVRALQNSAPPVSTTSHGARP